MRIRVRSDRVAFSLHAARWRRVQLAGMRADFSWRHSARAYEQLYGSILHELAQQQAAVS